jgi:Spy/CpxP family protein refolding chaperone
MTASSSSRARATAAVLLLALFGAGFAAGRAWDRLRPRRVELINTIDVQVRTGMPDELTRLDLTPEQTAQVRARLQAGRQGADSVLQRLEPQLRAVLDSVDIHIRALLTPEQRAQLDKERKGRMLRVIEQKTTTDGKTTTRSDTLRP